MSNYTFYVSDVKDLDIPRIVAENPQADVIRLSGNNDLWIVKQAWLEKFDVEDGLDFAAEHLNRNWGYGSASADHFRQGISFCAGQGLEVPGYKFRDSRHADYEKCLQCLSEARGYIRRLKVKVEVL